MSDDATEGLGRRDLLKRGAILGGAVVWTAPAIQTLAGPAYANGSPPVGETCDAQICLSSSPASPCVPVCLDDVQAPCCAAINAANAEPDPVLRFIAYLNALLGPCLGGTPTACPV